MAESRPETARNHVDIPNCTIQMAKTINKMKSHGSSALLFVCLRCNARANGNNLHARCERRRGPSFSNNK